MTDSFKIKEKITGKTDDNGTKDVEVMPPLKYLSNFWRTLEMSLIICQINFDLNWSKNQVTTFSITDKKLSVPVVTLSIQDNAKLLEQLNLVLKEQLTGININQKNQ